MSGRGSQTSTESEPSWDHRQWGKKLSRKAVIRTLFTFYWGRGKKIGRCWQFTFIAQKREENISNPHYWENCFANSTYRACIWSIAEREDRRHWLVGSGKKNLLRKRKIWRIQGTAHHVIAASILFNTDIALRTLGKQKHLLDPTLSPADFWRMTTLAWLFYPGFPSLPFFKYAYVKILIYIHSYSHQLRAAQFKRRQKARDVAQQHWIACSRKQVCCCCCF